VLAATPAFEQLTDEQLLDQTQHLAFQYFWNEANPTTGLIRDRSQSGSPCSIAANGFGFSAICIGIERGWITREQGRERVLTALETFWNGPQGTAETGVMGYKGFYYHFLHMTTGAREWACELSTIDTALLFAGIIDAKQFFDGSDPDEVQIRALADSIYYRADWPWFSTGSTGLRMGWKPTGGHFGTWVGYNEAMIMYLLALGSPTFPTDPGQWTTWTNGYLWQTWYGYSYVNFPPLFGHQYSHCWVDFRLVNDAYMRNRGITYFENSRRATLAQRAYAIANPFGRVGYSDSLWGFTASDDPFGYAAHGAPPPWSENGTITPTAPISSIPFAPQECIRVLRNLHDHWPGIWGAYGPLDAFNPTLDWYGLDWLGIDQGPIVMMIENYRTGRPWQRMMANADIRRGLERAGFLPVVGVEDPVVAAGLELSPATNPFGARTDLRFRLSEEAFVRLRVLDLAGREVARLVAERMVPGRHVVTFDAERLPAGVYTAVLETGGRSKAVQLVRLR
jgi:hypothetical protein